MGSFLSPTASLADRFGTLEVISNSSSATASPLATRYGDSTPRYTRELAPNLDRYTGEGSTALSARTPHPHATVSETSLLAARLNALEIGRSIESRIVVLRLTDTTSIAGRTEMDDPVTRFMLVQLPALANPEKLKSTVDTVHHSILGNFEPPAPGVEKESFTLACNHNRSECDLTFLLEAMFHGLDLLPKVTIPGTNAVAFDAYFRYVDERETAQRVNRCREVARGSLRFQVDVEVEYRGETADHGSRFFTMSNLRKGDSMRRLVENIMRVDFRMRLAVEYGGAMVSFWVEGRKLAEWEAVDVLCREDGERGLLQCVVHPNFGL
jgi:hypothetical protein